MLGYQISIGYVTLCRKDKHPLLLDCFLTSHRCITMIISASESALDLLMINTVSFLTKLPPSFKQNNQFGAPDQHGKCDNVP